MKLLKTQLQDERALALVPSDFDSLPNKAKQTICHRVVTKMRRDKTLPPAICSECGSANAHAHHEDYSKPNEVVFLCGSHHRARHGELKWGTRGLGAETREPLAIRSRELSGREFTGPFVTLPLDRMVSTDVLDVLRKAASTMKVDPADLCAALIEREVIKP